MKGFRAVLVGWLGGWILPVLALAAGLGLVLGGLVQVGQMTRDSLRSRERYTVSFADIDCTPPAGQNGSDFLAEVRYLAELPEQLHTLDENLARRLAEGFARHPCVEKVERVEIVAPRQVVVRLVYRTPVLAVLGAEEGDRHRLVGVVDGHGILLPASASVEDLPVFHSGSRPAGPAGTAWGDAAVEAAARTAGFLRPYQARLHLMSFETKAEGLVLNTPGGATVVWGHAPGAEEAGETLAARKVKRLLGYCEPEGTLDKPSKTAGYDVRFAEGKGG